MEKEQRQLLGEFKAGFEQTLKKREGLANVFTGLWEGQKRREMAQGMGLGVERVKALQKQVQHRLAKFAGQARGAVAEVLKEFHTKGTKGKKGEQMCLDRRS